MADVQVNIHTDISPGKPEVEADVPMEVANQPASVESKVPEKPASPLRVDNSSEVDRPASPPKSTSPTDSGISSLSTMEGGVITESMMAEELNLKEEGKEEEKKLQEEVLTVWERELEEQRYKRLQHLLEKSSIYSNFLLAKMDEQQKMQKKRQGKMNKKLKNDANENKNADAEKKSKVEDKKDADEATPVASKRTSRSKKQEQDSSSQESDSQKITAGRSTRSKAAGKSEPKEKSPTPASRRGRSRKRKVAETYTIANYLDRGTLTKKQKADDSLPRADVDSSAATEEVERLSDQASRAEDTPEEEDNSMSAMSEEQKTLPTDTQETTTKALKENKSMPSTATSAKPEDFVDTFSRTINGEKISDRQPDFFTGGVLRDYQLRGMEWLKVLYENGVNGILGDEMGLGKTVQCIALFAHIIKMGVPGPFLVCAPLSTLPNWLSEFERFTPTIPVLLYHGYGGERDHLRHKIYKKHGDYKVQPVVITSYEIVMRDRKALQHFLWKYIIIDEGHRIKNLNCRLIRELKCYQSANRLLLTGTPLQNNLSELWSMLNFLLPEVFDDLRTFESWFDFGTLTKQGGDEAIVAKEREKHVVSMLHQILTPFLLRRLKSDVDLLIPPKKEVLVYASLTPVQQEFYKSTIDRTILNKIKEKEMKDRELPVHMELTPSGRPKRRSCAKVDYSVMLDDIDPDKETEEDIERWMMKMEKAVDKPSTPKAGPKAAKFNIKMINIMMQLRKCCNHAYLLEYPLIPGTQEYRIDDELITSSGKLLLLDRLLPKLKQRDHKVLIFSQMTTMLDIIEDYCLYRKFQYCRLDGRMAFADRQQQIKDFNNNPDIFIFLLSTRAGGLGINLTSADTVIIYDSDWNPQCDLQAQDRCHRIGQTKPVVIYRLVTANTIDQEIVERASAKRRLEKMVIHQGKFKGGQKNIAKDSKSLINPKELLELLRSCDHSSEVGKNNNNEVITDTDLELLLDRSDLIEKYKAAQAGKGTEMKKHKGKDMSTDKETTSGVFKVIEEDDDTGATDLRILS